MCLDEYAHYSSNISVEHDFEADEASISPLKHLDAKSCYSCGLSANYIEQLKKCFGTLFPNFSVSYIKYESNNTAITRISTKAFKIAVNPNTEAKVDTFKCTAKMSVMTFPLLDLKFIEPGPQCYKLKLIIDM